MRELLDLFLTFCKIGVTTFGGGYAMLPVIRREIVENKGWATDAEVMDYYAVGQCTPGVIAVNTATFIGYKLKGVIGGIAATFGVIFPPLVIITVIAALINNFAELPVVAHALSGIRAAVCALVLSAVIKLFKHGINDSLGVVIFLVTIAVGMFTDFSPVYFVFAGAAVGITASVLRKRGEKQ